MAGDQAFALRCSRLVVVLSFAPLVAAGAACSSTSKQTFANASGGGPDGSAAGGQGGTSGGPGGTGGQGGSSGGQGGSSGGQGGSSGGQGGSSGAQGGTGGGQGGSSGGESDASGDGSPADAAGGAGGTSSDGSTGDSAADTNVPDGCVNPKPAAVFDASPTGSAGQACNPNNVMLADSRFAGLDCRATGMPAVEIDGQPICGCLGVDFGAASILDPLFIRMRSIPNACGTPCIGARCNSGHDLLVFSGSPGAYTFRQRIMNIANVPGDYPLASLGVPTRYLVLCRFAYAPDRDDIEIDSISSRACQ
jgi:hypothetical protein